MGSVKETSPWSTNPASVRVWGRAGMPTMPAAFPAARGACPREWPREVPLASARHVGAGFSPRLTGVVCLWRRQPPGAMSGHARPFPSSLPWTQGTLGLSWVHLSHRRGVCPPSPACPASLNDPRGGGRLQDGSWLPYQVLEHRRPFKMRRVGPGWGEGAPQSLSPERSREGSLQGQCGRGSGQASSVSSQLGLPEAELHLQ